MLEKTSYILRIDSCPEWSKYNRAATLAMCPGNENWEGEKFLTVLEWAARHFNFIRIDLSDTLNRHNLMMQGATEAVAIKQCKIEGDAWVAMHGKYLLECGKPFEIVRWDRWRFAPETQNMLGKLHSVIDCQEEFATAFAADIATYQRRLIARGHNPTHKFEEHCRNYLLEELACITLQAINLPGSSRIYPASEPQSSRLLRAGKVTGILEGLSKEYYVAFNLRRRSWTPTSASLNVRVS